MKRHIYRTLLIWAVLVVGVINIVPTIGWMTLEDDPRWLALSQEEQNIVLEDPERKDEWPAEGTRQARQVNWRMEDDARAADPPGAFMELAQRIKRWAEFDRDQVINLGLDLQGGVHMIIGFDHNDVGEEKLAEFRENGWSDAEIADRVQKTVLEQVRRRVNQFEAKEPIIQALGTNQVNIQLPGEKDTERAKQLIMKTAQLTFHIVASPDETAQLIRDLRRAFPNRIENFVRQDELQPDRLVVTEENLERVQEIIDSAERQGLIPEDKLVLFSRPPKPNEPQEYTLYLLDKKPGQTGEGLTSAFALPDPSRPPNWKITFAFNPAAGVQFGEMTEKNIGQLMAIVLDDVVVSAATINDRITTSGEITGSFDPQEAIDISIALDSGSMVVPVHEEYVGVVGASLGKSAIHSGVVSALAGTALVGVFMLIYYHLAGIIALIGLALNGLVLVAAMAYFDLTLTLPGIAGLLLTVGMAVDANIIIYERIREELKLGHSLISSIDNGFSRAAVPILDANVTTLIAAVVLMEFGTGPIEGFAVALSIGVCSSVFAALVLSRAMFDFALEHRIITKLSFASLVPDNAKLPFLAWRTRAMFTSIAVILIGIGFFGFRLFGPKDMLGVDFTKGTNAHVEILADSVISADDVRIALEKAGFKEPIVQTSSTGMSAEALQTQEQGRTRNGFVIRVGESGSEQVGAAATPTDAPAAPGENAAETPATPDPAAANADVVTVDTRIQEALAPLAGGVLADVQMVEVQTVGAAVATQLGWDAIWSMIFALIFIVLYLGFRFEPKYALGAVVALFHDVLVTVGLLAVFGEQITMNIVAAVLTIIGYSLNDTIVVFDRVREDVRAFRGQGMKFTALLDHAINVTLSRTLLTSLTTLFVVVVLWLFGGPAIHGFALALIIGIIAGTYSTVFIASPVVYLVQYLQGRHVPPNERDAAEGGRRRQKSKKARARQTEESVENV